MTVLNHVDRTDADKRAADRILKTRTATILTNRFYGVLISNIVPVLSRKFPTAATNGKQHFFNPDFINRLQNHKQVNFVQRHESEHDARHHSTRRGGRDPKKWNIATDLAINIDLVDEIAKGADMEVPPEDVLGGKIWVDAKYRGWSAEDIYRARELDEQKAAQEKQKQNPVPQDDDADDEDDANDTGDSEAGDEGNDTGDSDDAGDDAGDEAGDDTEGEGSEASDESGDESGDSEADGSDADGDGNADDEAEEGDVDGDGNGKADDTGEANDAEPESVVGDMPGGLGEVLDATDDPVEASDEEAKWERVIRQAASIGKGDTPDYALREIARANDPKQNWREQLRTYFDQGAAQIETWNRPNRRFIGHGTILPGTQREGLNEVVFLIDTSGSMDDVALKAIATETQAALDEGIIDKLHVVYGDVRVTRTDEYVGGEEIEFDPKGGGGTELRPLFDWAKDNVPDASLIVTFTDGYIESEEALGEHPASQVLWAFTGYPDVVANMIANARWGDPGIDVGAH